MRAKVAGEVHPRELLRLARRRCGRARGSQDPGGRATTDARIDRAGRMRLTFPGPAREGRPKGCNTHAGRTETTAEGYSPTRAAPAQMCVRNSGPNGNTISAAEMLVRKRAPTNPWRKHLPRECTCQSAGASTARHLASRPRSKNQTASARPKNADDGGSERGGDAMITNPAR